jgi:hypothetical protein
MNRLIRLIYFYNVFNTSKIRQKVMLICCYENYYTQISCGTNPKRCLKENEWTSDDEWSMISLWLSTNNSEGAPGFHPWHSWKWIGCQCNLFYVFVFLSCTVIAFVLPGLPLLVNLTSSFQSGLFPTLVIILHIKKVLKIPKG